MSIKKLFFSTLIATTFVSPLFCPKNQGPNPMSKTKPMNNKNTIQSRRNNKRVRDQQKKNNKKFHEKQSTQKPQ